MELSTRTRIRRRTARRPPRPLYDAGLNAGYNVETKVTPVGGSGCPFGGCTSALSLSSLPNLQVSGGGAVVGRRDPCDACTNPNPPAPATR